jgi:hypothetical protein
VRWSAVEKGHHIIDVSDEISRPIARDAHRHIEYVPTQVVTEYVSARYEDRPVEGIRYRSSKNPKGTALVLFADDRNLVLDHSEMTTNEHLWRDRWLRLVAVRRRRVTAATIRRYHSR